MTFQAARLREGGWPAWDEAMDALLAEAAPVQGSTFQGEPMTDDQALNPAVVPVAWVVGVVYEDADGSSSVCWMGRNDQRRHVSRGIIETIRDRIRQGA